MQTCAHALAPAKSGQEGEGSWQDFEQTRLLGRDWREQGMYISCWTFQMAQNTPMVVSVRNNLYLEGEMDGGRLAAKATA